MDKYERLVLNSQEITGQVGLWQQNMNEFWRRADRDRRSDLDEHARNTVTDVVRYCYLDPHGATTLRVLPDSFIQCLSGRADMLPFIVGALDAIVRTGAEPASLGMLSNWVSLVDYGIEPTVGADCAGVLRETVAWLTREMVVHPWDSAIVYMATQLSHEFSTNADTVQLAQECAMDDNPKRLATRCMTVMEHTPCGLLWWQTVNGARGGSAQSPMPQLPIAREVIKRKDRANQAWWRYGPEMEATPEYAWTLSWMSSLICPGRDDSFSINGLL